MNTQALRHEKGMLLIKATRLSKKLLSRDLDPQELMITKEEHDQTVDRISEINKDLAVLEA